MMKNTAIICFLLCGFITSAQTKKAPASRPNFVFILADDLGYGDPSCYGQKHFTTPHIDQLAKEGMKFLQAYAGTAVCSPSRSSLMTGLTTGHTPIRGNLGVKPEGQYPLPDSVPIIPQVFKASGYRSGCFGKWGLGYPGSEGDPVKKGFDEFYGYNCQTLAHNYYPYHLWHNFEKVELPENSGNKTGAYAPELIHKQALKFIEDNRKKPFILFYTTTVPHAEVAAPKSFMEAELGKYGIETPFVGADTTAAGFKKSGPYMSQPKPHAGYAAMIKYLDTKVGEIEAKLKSLGLDKNTIVIFTSDNGPSIEGGEDPVYFNSSGGLRGHKRDLYEGGIREPMVVKWPGRIKPGSVTSQPVAFWDVLPTFADIMHQPLKIKTDGLSFKPTLLGQGVQKQHSYFYWEFHEQGGSMAMRIKDWKGVRGNIDRDMNGPIELYDLKTDPAETHNVAGAHPEVVKQMAALFAEAHTASPVWNFNTEKGQSAK